jgi:AhpD family alkylhydroperoxidase
MHAKVIVVVLALSGICLFAEDAKTVPLEEKILRNVEKKKGFRPWPLQLMAQRKGTLPSFMKYGNGLFENGPLSPKEVYLVALSAAVAMHSPTCIRAHTKSAMENGATDEEILQAVLVAGLISNTAPLHVAGEEVLKIIKKK